jgi:PhnB protein
MSADNRHIRHGIGSVRPFIDGQLDLLDFATQVFRAVELERNRIDKGFRARIGDSVVVLSAMDPPVQRGDTRVYVYVDDVDATHERAISAGGVSLSKPSDRAFQEHTAGVKDSFGNLWYLAEYTGRAVH